MGRKNRDVVESEVKNEVSEAFDRLAKQSEPKVVETEMKIEQPSKVKLVDEAFQADGWQDVIEKVAEGLIGLEKLAPQVADYLKVGHTIGGLRRSINRIRKIGMRTAQSKIHKSLVGNGEEKRAAKAAKAVERKAARKEKLTARIAALTAKAAELDD